MESKLKNSSVTVAVMTYNSAMFVNETLESIKAQTYPDIELIISDDGSQDNTLKIVREWISMPDNKQRFKSIDVLEVPENTGIPANCNRALRSAGSEWIVFLAGDDILLPNFLEDNMDYVEQYPEAMVIFSQVKVYNNTFEEDNYVRSTPAEFPENLMHPDFSAEDQYKILIECDRVTYTPSCFASRKAISLVGGFDETFPLIEDYPMWLKLTGSGTKLYYFHKPTVGYRMHQNAINNTGDNILFKPSEINSYPLRKEYAHPYLPWMIVAKETWNYRVSKIFKACGWTKSTTFLRWWYVMWTVHLNPFLYLEAINRRVSKK